jgi:RNA polymerase sigma-70 factor (ECF subfamily)
LLQRARAADQEAWRQLVHLYGPLVQRWCQRAGLQEEDTADVFQETFRSVSRDLASFRPEQAVGSFRGWLRSIVRTKIADHFRRLQRHGQGEGGTDAQRQFAALAESMPAETDDDIASEKVLLLHRALEIIRPEFSPTNWNAFQQVAMDGHSAVEVAERLQIDPQAVRQANYRIRRRLRSVLQDVGE